MSFWADETWINASKIHEYVSGFKKENLSDGAYQIALGGEAIVSSGHTDQGSKSAYRKLKPDGELKLQPGQFAYLITEESVRLTTGVIGFINVASKTKLKGLVNISGFHVDAGYEGKLIFTVFNAGPIPISLYQGEKLFRLWLSDFRGYGSRKKKGFNAIPRDWADRLNGTYPSPFALSARIAEVEKQLGELRGQRIQFIAYAFIISIFLFPFVAGLYSSVFAPWFSNATIERVLDPFFKRTPAPAFEKLPTGTTQQPAANNPSTGAKQNEPKQR